MGRKHSSTSAARVGRSRRAGQALELRKAGLTFREIGRRMGFSEQRAHALVTEELARLNADRAEQADAVTRLEVERLDALFAAVYPKALRGNMGAVDRCLMIMARRAKMLGIDKEKGGFGGVVMQNLNVPAVEMTPQQRVEAVRQVLCAAARPGGPNSEAAQLLALMDSADVPLTVEASPAAREAEAEPVQAGTNGNGRCLPNGLRELPGGGPTWKADDVLHDDDAPPPLFE
jgi:hypothetical protein